MRFLGGQSEGVTIARTREAMLGDLSVARLAISISRPFVILTWSASIHLEVMAGRDTRSPTADAQALATPAVLASAPSVRGQRGSRQFRIVIFDEDRPCRHVRAQ